MLEQFRIIVVDDDQPHLEALCSQLQEAGFDVNGFSDSTVALEQLTSQRFEKYAVDPRSVKQQFALAGNEP